MINTIKQALTTREIRRKLELMVFVIFITRVISMIPVPGIDASVFKQWMAVNSNDALNLFSAFTGGSFENFSMFALGITPLITAQIVVQLLGSVIPSLGKLQKRGEHGQKVTKRITNIVGIVLAIVQSCCMAIGFNKGGLINGNGVACVILITTFMTAGTGIMMWLAHILDEKAIGNGVSILLMANILSRMPGQFASLFKSLAKDKSTPIAALSITAAILIFAAIIIVIIYMTEGSPAACTVFTEDESVWRRRRNRSYPGKSWYFWCYAGNLCFLSYGNSTADCSYRRKGIWKRAQ